MTDKDLALEVRLQASRALNDELRAENTRLREACEWTMRYFDRQMLSRDEEPRFLDRVREALAAAQEAASHDTPGIWWAEADARRQDKGESLGEPWK